MNEKIPTDNDKGIGETLNSYSEVTQEKLVCHECGYEGFMGVQKGALSTTKIFWYIGFSILVLWQVIDGRWLWVLISIIILIVVYAMDTDQAKLFQCPQCKKLLKKE